MTARDRLLHVLRTPPAPSTPEGDEQVQVFRASPGYFRYRALLWGLRQGAGVIGLVIGLAVLPALAPRFWPSEVNVRGFKVTREMGLSVARFIELAAVPLFLFQAGATLALLRLDYEQRWYVVSDRSIRIREGLLRIHERTMTHANIQHVAIRQGPVQRWLGIADVEVRTAGGGATEKHDHDEGKDLHISYFRGVDNALAIRDLIRRRLEGHADAGLGDPDDVEPAHAPSALVGASVLLRDEARALRLAMEAEDA